MRRWGCVRRVEYSGIGNPPGEDNQWIVYPLVNPVSLFPHTEKMTIFP